MCKNARLQLYLVQNKKNETIFLYIFITEIKTLLSDSTGLLIQKLIHFDIHVAFYLIALDCYVLELDFVHCKLFTEFNHVYRTLIYSSFCYHNYMESFLCMKYF
jgi:hypothetical protein